MRVKAVFLDRDGVINRYPGDAQYVKCGSEFKFLPGVKAALKRLNAAGYVLFIVSNQAGIAKGLFSQEELDKITLNMLKEFEDCRIKISGVYYCTHRTEDNCSCRKPKAGLIEKAITDSAKDGCAIERAASFFVGDTIRDILTGKNSGLKTILVFSGKEKPQNKNDWEVLPDFTAPGLAEAAGIIIGR